MDDVYLDRIAWAVGEEARTVQECARDGGTYSGAEALAGAGFAVHHVAGPETDAYALAARALRALTLPRVGAILAASCLPLNANAGDPAEFDRTGDVKHLMRYPGSRLQAEFGWSDAMVVGVGQQGCTGLLGALRLARALLLTEPELDPVLCLTADRFPPGAAYEQSYNLVSDGAVACTVSRQPGRYRLLGVQQLTDGALEYAADDEVVGSYFTGTCAVVRDACAAVGMKPDEADWLVPQNTDARAVGVLARLLGIDADRIQPPSTGSLGHVIAGDNLINLALLERSGRLEPGQRLLLPVAGYGMNWQCAVLEVAELPGD